MRRPLILAILGVALLAAVLVMVFVSQGRRTSTNIVPTPTATPVVLPTQPPIHGRVTLAPEYRTFLKKVCGAFKRHRAGAIGSVLLQYKYNYGVYWGDFNFGQGHFANNSLLDTWLARGHPYCVRVAPSFQNHGVLVTAGWAQGGGWSILDLDKLNGWRIDDFTFGSRARVLGAFFSNDRLSTPFSG